MDISKLGTFRTLNILHEEHDYLNEQFHKLSSSIIKKHGIAKALKSNQESTTEELAYDIAFFCFTKSIRLNESIEAVIKICNYEDAYALLRGAYELYVYMAFIRADNNRISDSIFKIGLEAGMYKHPVTKKGKLNKSLIVDTTNNNVYQYGLGIFEKVQQSPFASDKEIHNIIYKFLSEHCHVNMMTSGNYREDKTLRYKINGGNHEQLPYLLFLKNFIYTNLLYEISFYVKSAKVDYNRIIKKVVRNQRFLNAFLHYSKFSTEGGTLLNPIFLERINAIELP